MHDAVQDLQIVRGCWSAGQTRGPKLLEVAIEYLQQCIYTCYLRVTVPFYSLPSKIFERQ